MARVTSLLNISGTIGDLTIRQTEFGGVAGLKPGPTRERVLTSEKFERTRRNAGEFTLSIKNATLLRRALGGAIDGVRNALLSARMNKLLHHAAMQDEQNGYGFRQVSAGSAGLLTGFEFNHKLSLDKALPVRFEHHLDVVTGAVRLEVPSFLARRKKGYPPGATHCRIISCAAVVDFAHECYANTIKASELLPLGKKTPNAICLDHRLTLKPGEVLLQTMGMAFYKVEHGEEVLLKGGAMRILEAVQLPEIRVEELQEPVPVRKEGEEVKPFRAKELLSRSGLGYHFKWMNERDREVGVENSC